ncbi:QueT transporter family protein [Sporosarcina sp.]|uniref:QueT transporter family protein n=1 Tax=Sporosarcina sp. TaxID=49982 RepID=UPI00260EB7F7|nr:QueT transporter family protein [Sporosarcina sp.]
MNVKTLAISGIIAALYTAITLAILPFGFTNIQFRISEMFNHLVVFNPRYIFGIVVGVFVSNLLLSELGPIDLVFGVGQSIIALSLTILFCRYVSNTMARMVFNTFIFTTTMFLIAWELNIVLHLPFLLTWLYVAIGEFAVMAIGIPVMKALNKRLNFARLI